MKHFDGKVLFLDRSDINTDEIIPAKYLTEISKEALAPYLLEDLKLPGFDPKRDCLEASVIVTRNNFGCGSSREHAPWALEVNGIHLVIAPNFARIFKQNMFNCGMMAVELDEKIIDELFEGFAGGELRLSTDFEEGLFHFSDASREQSIPFEISDYNRRLVKAGGWVEYADSHY